MTESNMVGRIEEARFALEGDLPRLATTLEREIYLLGDVVYKTDRGKGLNDYEWGRYLEIRRRPLHEWIRVPTMSRFDIDGDVVIAAEYVEGTLMGVCAPVRETLVSQLRSEPVSPGPDAWVCSQHDRCVAQWIAEYVILQMGVTDTDEGNIIRDSDGRYWVVDLAD